ncbi:MAG: ketopantoate reductase family protein [Dorea sp.]
MRIENVALLGAGAVGAYFIWGLSEKLGDNFSVVAKGARKERLEKEGLMINGKKYDLLVKKPEEVRGVDLLLVSCKQDALPELLEDIRTIVSDNTIVISLLNGVSSEEIIGNAIGMEHMLYAVMRIASVRNGNQITFSVKDTAGIYLGEKEKKDPTERVMVVEELFKDTGIRYNFVENIILDMWIKYASNVAQNLPQAVLGIGFQAYKDSKHMYFIAEKLWKEVSQIANAKGIPLTDRFLLFRGVKPYARFSTLQDLDAGRHTEIEMLAGEMIRMGKECKIPVPYCEYTYHLVKALEEKNDGKFEYGV